MTTPKQALEAARKCIWSGGDSLATVAIIDEALASLQGEDAVERVAGCICQNQHRRGYCTEPGCPYSTSDAVEKVKALAHRFWSIHPSTIAAMNLTREEFYVREMMALLAAGLVPDEAAIRAAAFEEAARELEQSYPDHAWLNAACAAIRAAGEK